METDADTAGQLPKPKLKKIQMTLTYQTSATKPGLHLAIKNNMASGGEETPNPEALVSFAALETAMANLEKSFFENMSIFFKPFYAQMEEMQKEVREAKTIAENARSANLATQNVIHQLQQLEDVLAEKAIKTDMTLRQNNLKIRGLQEKLGKNEELSEIISKWLEKEVPPTGNISPIITKAFRAGPTTLLKTRPARDINLTAAKIYYVNFGYHPVVQRERPEQRHQT
ncbi:UNVERIFIED_CONTAM: hypothetical protein K2H54_014068 [Gekko kuhli]